MRFYATVLFLLFPSPALSEPPTKPIIIENTMTRTAFQAAHSKGPQRFIATVRVDPVMKQGRFVGYRLVGVAADSSDCWAHPLTSSVTGKSRTHEHINAFMVRQSLCLRANDSEQR